MMAPGRRLMTRTRSDKSHCFQQVVGDEERGLALLLKRLGQVALENHPGLRVNRRKRLVEQQDVWIDRKRAC